MRLLMLVVLLAIGIAYVPPLLRSAIEGGGLPPEGAEHVGTYTDAMAEGELATRIWDPLPSRLGHPVIRVVRRTPCPQPHVVEAEVTITHSRTVRVYGLFASVEDHDQPCAHGLA